MQKTPSSVFLLAAFCGAVLIHPTKTTTPRISCNRTVRNVTFQAHSTLRNFNSPSYPRAYPLGITCTYLFTAPRGHRIELTFSTFNMEGASPKCTNDYIEVRDGPSEKSTLIKRLCGAIKPVPIISSVNSIYLFFESNDQFVFQGFRGTYRAASEVEIAKCTEERTSAHLFSRGHFTSPTYPSKYPPSRVCSWTLQAPPGNFMKVTFDAFQTQCPNDKVIVRDNDQNGQQLGEFCGGEKPPVFRGGKLWVRFISDNDIILSAERGFNATYEALPFKGHISDHCTGQGNKLININESTSGTIKSPWAPDLYPNNLNCVWRIRAPAGKQVKLSFSLFDLESPCNTDYVEVSDVTTGASEQRGKYCGDHPDVVSASEEVMVQFVTGPKERRKGFVMQYALNGGSCVYHSAGRSVYLLAVFVLPVFLGIR